MKIAARVTMLSMSLTLAAVMAWKPPVPPVTAARAVEPPDDEDAPECPGPYFAVPMKHKNTGISEIAHEVEIAKGITEVPEFHDCQRFVKSGKYEALYAVFVSDTIDSLFTGGQLDTDTAYAVAEVYTRLGTYKPLGIRPGFNCLFLSRRNNWEAFMYSAGPGDDDACGRFMTDGQRNSRDTKQLTVKRVTVPDMLFGHYPPVTRWDRGKDGNYYIGVKCGAAWCEIGLTDPGKSSDPLPTTSAMNHGQKRVRLIKGWYDQQVLAVPDGDLSVKPQPQGKRGVVIPHPGLKQEPFPIGHFRPVATILMDDIHIYGIKLGMKKGTNRLFLRQKSPGVFDAMVVAPDGSSRQHDVIARSHEGQHMGIPGTVRWRWLAKDETIWVRCLEGCCQVQQTGGDGEGSPMPVSSREYPRAAEALAPRGLNHR